MPNITLYFLQASRSIRTAWQLEELGLDYNVEFSEREHKVAPQPFKEQSGDSLGKFPLLTDGDLTVGESGAIAQYLCDTYDKSHCLIPTDAAQRVKALRWLHAAEATFCLHAIGILYVRWFGEKTPEAASTIEEGMSKNVQKDLDWLERELGSSGGEFLLGAYVTIADIMMQFSIDFIFARELGTKGKKWPGIENWLQACKETDSYRKAVGKTGHKL